MFSRHLTKIENLTEFVWSKLQLNFPELPKLSFNNMRSIVCSLFRFSLTYTLNNTRFERVLTIIKIMHEIEDTSEKPPLDQRAYQLNSLFKNFLRYHTLIMNKLIAKFPLILFLIFKLSKIPPNLYYN